MKSIEGGIHRRAGGQDRTLNEAADWLVRLQNDDLSLEQITQWQQWLESNPKHRFEFDRLQSVWSAMESLPDQRVPEIPAPVRRYRYYAAAAMFLVCLVVLMAWQRGIWSPTLSASSSAAKSVFETTAGEHLETTLTDGSHLSLGAKSLVWIRFVASEREVILDHGEAYFRVAKNPDRPFRVRAGIATITAVGTAFDVRRSGELVHVAVSEGSVNIDRDVIVPGGTARKRAETPLRAGFEARIDPNAAQSTTASALSTDTVASWRNGRLEYLDEPLKFVIDDVNRYLAHPIIIGDPAVGELRLTGTVSERDIDAWLVSVADLLPVKVERDASGIVILHNAAHAERAESPN